MEPLQDVPKATQCVECRFPVSPQRFFGLGGWLFLGLLLVGLPQASARVQNPSLVSCASDRPFRGLFETEGRECNEAGEAAPPFSDKSCSDAREAACCEPALGAALSSDFCTDGFLVMPLCIMGKWRGFLGLDVFLARDFLSVYGLTMFLDPFWGFRILPSGDWSEKLGFRENVAKTHFVSLSLS